MDSKTFPSPLPEDNDLTSAPDSWELADLEESVTRLMVSSSKNNEDIRRSDPDPSLLGFVDDDASSSAFASPFSSTSAPSNPSPVAAVASSSAGKFVVGDLSEEMINQVDQFLREALEKPRERLSILRMEQDVQNFIRDPRQQQLEFSALPTSYLRLAAHRVAQHYCLQSVAVPDNSMPDGSGSKIVLLKTSGCHFPPIRLADIPIKVQHEDKNDIVKVAIKQRSQKNSQSIDSIATKTSKTNQLKSVEERKEEYNRARARIFNSNEADGGNSGIGAAVKSESNSTLQDNFQQSSLMSSQTEDRVVTDSPFANAGRCFGESCVSSGHTGRGRMERELVSYRQKASSKVAIFRDRDVDRKDPDYDRNYDRYMQRFDPGFGFIRGPYTMQAMYSPALNYNTEFPQLGSSHGPQISVDHHHIQQVPQHIQQVPQHIQGTWAPTSSPSGHSFIPPEGMFSPSSTNQVAYHPSSIYSRSAQHVVPPRPVMTLIHTPEHVQPFAQTRQQQPETNFGLARPQ